MIVRIAAEMNIPVEGALGWEWKLDVGNGTFQRRICS